MTSAVAAARLELLRAGFAPLPLSGKRPAFDKWSLHFQTNRTEIDLWDQLYPYASNTGILTRLTPTIDIDITDPDAAAAVESLARERFEERGYVLVRIGKAPKRAIPLRTDNPFAKIVRNVTAPNGVEHKIELLCDGQQVVCFGDHPDTHQPYTWHGGQLGTIKHEDLPYVSREEAAQFVDDAVDLLVQQFAFKLSNNRPTAATAAREEGHADWSWLLGNIHAGRELHDTSVVLASKLITSGMGDGAAVNMLRGLFEASGAPHDARWQERYDEIPRDVESARIKFGGIAQKPQQQANGHDKSPPAAIKPTSYVLPEPAMIPSRNWFYCHHYMAGVATSTVAPGGFGKTSLAIYEALEMVKAGFRVWYVSAEDDRDELDRRIAAYVKRHGMPDDLWGRFFVDDKLTFPFKIARAGRGGVIFDDAKLEGFEAAIATNRIDVVILDPFISFHYLPENDTAAMDALVKRLGDICARQRMCIELPHHVRKRPAGGGEITVDDARGAGAIVNAVRSCRVINVMSTVEAEQAEIPRDKRLFYLRIDSGKSNMAPPEKARWLHLASVEIANGDNVGVIEPWEFPKVFGKISTADVEWVQELLRAGIHRVFRADSRSPEWLGHELAQRFGRRVEVPGDCKWINAVLSTWVQNGVIGKELRTDKDRKERVCYVPVVRSESVVVPFAKPVDEMSNDDD
jgi:hypothetical protein